MTTQHDLISSEEIGMKSSEALHLVIEFAKEKARKERSQQRRAQLAEALAIVQAVLDEEIEPNDYTTRSSRVSP